MAKNSTEPDYSKGNDRVIIFDRSDSTSHVTVERDGSSHVTIQGPEGSKYYDRGTEPSQ